ncbi:MAG: VCBS repeat-containing protein [Oscillochloris sp.]|nr:VCBS repeat-containing protein [Oscillochloris sp.]
MIGGIDQASRIFRNNGTTLELDNSWVPDPADTRSVVLADIDGDRDLDLVLGNNAESSRIYLNRCNPAGVTCSGAAGFSNAPQWEDSATRSIRSIAAGDVDHDGDLDLAFGVSSALSTIAVNSLAQIGDPQNATPIISLGQPGAPPASQPAGAAILETPTIAINLALRDAENSPIRAIRALYSFDNGGTWQAAILNSPPQQVAAPSSGNTLPLNWNVFESKFFGRSDTVLFRVQAYPTALKDTLGAGSYTYSNQTAGSSTRPFATGATLSFRVRGAQIRVLNQAGDPVPNAIIYRLPNNSVRNATLLVDSGNQALTTDLNGYLSGRATIAANDSLAALQPLQSEPPFTNKVERYLSSPINPASGLPETKVIANSTGSNVQTLTVAPDRPLLLFNLNIGLEWEAGLDEAYQTQLRADLLRASELLYDWTDGQAALGRLNVGYGPSSLNDADIRVYATNRLRPNAFQGGITEQIRADPDVSGKLYVPGYLSMGSVWTRYGGGSSFGEDWARALAHELGHYLFYLDDNYIGRDAATEALISIPRRISDPACPGAMTDPYREDYSEFQPPGPAWESGGNCALTLSAAETGRSDWATIKKFYDSTGFALNQPSSFNPAAKQGPSAQILTLTNIVFPEVSLDNPPLPAPIFSLIQADGSRYFYRPGKRVRAFLFTADGQRIIDLGRPNLDQIDARGARIGDSVCVYATSDALSGCVPITADTEALTLVSQPWQPDIEVAPLAGNQLQISLRSNIALGSTGIQATIFPGPGPNPAPITTTISGAGPSYTATVPVNEAFNRGYVRLRAGAQEVVTEYTIRGTAAGSSGATLADCKEVKNPAPPPRKIWVCTNNAPTTTSADGQFLIYSEQPADGKYYTLQTATSLPSTPAWSVAVGQPYRLITNLSAEELLADKTYVTAAYLENELPAGSEGGLAIYFYDQNAAAWLRLPTSRFDPDRNEISARAIGAGLYALMTRVEVEEGWNLVSYPWPEALPVLDAVGQLNLRPETNFTTIHSYTPTEIDDPWKVYDVDAPYWVNDLADLEYGKGYWFIVPSGGATPPPWKDPNGVAAALPNPPALFYGPAPAAGLPVSVWNGDQRCAVGSTISVPLGEDQPDGPRENVFVIAVPHVGQSDSAACGIPGQILTIRIGDEIIATRPWTNARPSLVLNLYVPLIVK